MELSWQEWATPVHQAGPGRAVFQPRDLIQSRPERKEILAPGEGAERQGRWKVGNVTSRIVASAPEVLGLLAGVWGGGSGEGGIVGEKRTSG